jgi:hypothetical protein
VSAVGKTLFRQKRRPATVALSPFVIIGEGAVALWQGYAAELQALPSARAAG